MASFVVILVLFGARVVSRVFGAARCPSHRDPLPTAHSVREGMSVLTDLALASASVDRPTQPAMQLMSSSPLLSSRSFAAGSLAAQQPADSFPLTVPSIMRGEEVVGRPPARVRWTADGKWIYFSWVEPGTDWREPNASLSHRARGRREARAGQPCAHGLGGARSSRGEIVAEHGNGARWNRTATSSSWTRRVPRAPPHADARARERSAFLRHVARP